MSAGWSPTGTRAMPGRSTSVMVSTYGLLILSRICFSEMALLEPVSRSVSAWISALRCSVARQPLRGASAWACGSVRTGWLQNR
jgi:hypothetical protein